MRTSKNYVEFKYCECGCQKTRPKYSKHRGKKIARFIWGHNGRIRHKPNRIDDDGYVLIHKPDHPFSNSEGFIRQHRLIYEETNQCVILSHAIVHHINGNVQDNHISNLQLMSRAEHNVLHHRIDVSNRRCLRCKRHKTSTYKKKPHHTPVQKWYRFQDGFLCKICYDRFRLSTKGIEDLSE